MAKPERNIPLAKLDDLFTVEEERMDAKLEKVIDIKLTEIDDFPNHPFKVIENEELYAMRDSIKDNGVLVPALVRQKPDGRYEMISGHRRRKASELADNTTIPCIVRNLTDDEATIIMVDSNLQREELLPSERAFAYKMKLEALKHQGKRNDLTSGQLVQKLDTADMVGKDNNDSGRQVRRFIRLTYLIPEMLQRVDEKFIALSPAVELSFLTQDEQRLVIDAIDKNVAYPSHAQTIKLRKMSQEGTLTDEVIDDMLAQEKPNQVQTLKFNESKIRSVLPRGLDDDKMEDFVVKAISFYGRYLEKKRSEKDSR